MYRKNIVILCKGQSNMGTVSRLRDVHVPLNSVYLSEGGGVQQDIRLCRLYEGTEHPWHRLESYGPTGITRFGPEISLAVDLHAHFGNDVNIWIVQSVYGSTSLASHWDPDATTGLNLFNNTIAFYHRQVQLIADNMPGTVSLAAVVYGQGESDGYDPNNSSAYGVRLEAMLNALDTQLGVVPTIINKLSSAQTAVPFPDGVRNGQDYAVGLQTHRHIVETDDLTTLTDLLHYDPDSMIELGKRAATILKTEITL